MNQTVFQDKSIPYQIRFLAILQLKNGIDKYYRLYAQANGIKAEEKAMIRSRLFQGSTDIEDNMLAFHNALVAAKIVRIDYPAEWPEAFSEIIDLLRSTSQNDQTRLHGALQILLRVVKELGSARLRKSQTALQSVTPEITYVLAEIYTSKSADWTSVLAGGQGDEQSTNLAMANSLLALKAFRRLVIMGYEQPHRDDTVQRFWATSQDQFGQFLKLVNSDSNVPSEFQDIVGKHLLQFAKLHIEVAEQQPASFPRLPNSLPLTRAYWDLVATFSDTYATSGGIRQGPSEGGSKPKVEGALQERLALKGLLLLRACCQIAFKPVQTFKYRSADLRQEQNEARDIIKNELLTPDLAAQIANTIITSLFVFRKADLEAWEEGPEEWEHQEQSEGQAYAWEVRPCAEKLFLDLLTSFKETLIPPVLSYFQQANNSQADVATKEAVYTTMGLSAGLVVDHFDFDAVLHSSILQDAQLQGGLHKILRRRIAILLSEWSSVKLTENSRPIVYQIFRHLLSSQDETNDLVVRITAGRELRWIVDELGFDVQAFIPYAADVLVELLSLAHELETDDTKIAVLESARILVQRLEENVSQVADQLMTALPQIWEDAGAEGYMIKQSVVSIFAALVMSLGPNSQRYHHLMVPLITEAATPGSDLHSYLIDEVLELWNNILMQSQPPLSPEIISLATFALPLLDRGNETASESLSALETYILLAPNAMLEDQVRRPMITALTNLIDAKSYELKNLSTACIEYMIRSSVELGGTAGINVITQDMIESGFMHKIMSNLHDAFEAHQTTGPNRQVAKIDPLTRGDHLAILARLALAEPSTFVSMLTTYGSLEQVWHWLSSEWFGWVLCMDNLERQKLHLLGLTRLLELPSPMQELALGRLQDYFSIWINTVAELSDGVNNGSDCLIWAEVEAEDYDTPKIIAERQVAAKDPIHTVHAFGFVRERLHHLVSRVGGEQAFQKQWAVNVDKDLLDKFGEMAASIPS